MIAKRPLSPHLQVYRLPLTGLISIAHRITGLTLAIGLILVVYMLIATAVGETAYRNMQSFMASGLCRGAYWGFIFALFFHLCHGVRHLIWDLGKTLEKDTLTYYAAAELSASLILTVATVYLL